MNVRSLGYVVIESTEPQKWLDYGTQVLGLMVAPGMPDDAVYLKMDERPFRFAVVQGASDRLQICGWELQDEADFQTARVQLEAAGVDYIAGTEAECQARRVRELLRLQDPAGNTLELYHGADLDYLKFVSPVGIPSFETGFNGDMGFGHTVLPAPNLDETHAFYRDVLGFGDSDSMHFKFSDDPADPGLGLKFMHVNNPRHHSLALYQGESPVGCIHLMVEVKSVDEVGYCLDRVLARDIPVTSTLGRHTNDRMLSFYMLTPAGFPMEFGCEGLQIDWANFKPTKSALPSIWGHKFAAP
ncbi:biphenyl 2,3-dioxygenase [Halieaceae bacterium IMCC14734]|uniref:Biphenyl 2,3-dioxygenase n=1 Tax=Candidatus Litorirhabdus singularis TaxID=2518993 RepID=A0ABT3THR1_9GAMM|nr:VOC family protein [Candidatus Litorirhabdus singularis]MCX2981866.1 biphenyl 2,3-dioxygenase [Candidatus Litorirhabdus singularis]